MARPRKASRSSAAKTRSGPPRAATRRRTREQDLLPERVYAQASPHSVGGVSLFEAGALVTEEAAVAFTSDRNLILNAAARLQSAGFEILQLSQTTINIAGPPRLYEQMFGTQLFTDERQVIKEFGRTDTATFIESADTDLPGFIDPKGSQFEDALEGIAIEEPRYPFQNAFAPLQPYWHLRVPGDVSLGMNADRAHRARYTGRGVRVVMVDSGWFRHPYFVQRGYRSSPVVLGPGSANPTADESGHGTAESANLFAVAPDVDFTMVKINFVNTTGAFNAAVALGPQIISNSWGSDVRNAPLSAANQALAAAIALAVQNGTIVVFSAGNGHFGFPGQHPDVISAGGAYMEADGTFRASDYASGFTSPIYAGRNSPDICGLVGLRPRAAYIMLPLEPNDNIDRDMAGGAHPNGDQTAPNDGWAAISGTSAAAPQVAGVCALMRQACPRLTPAEIKSILKSTARDVTAGATNPASGGLAAAPGPDVATGNGLVDAQRATLVARVRCLGPIRIQPPVEPIRPIRVEPPILPIAPIRPPIEPIGPPIQPPISPIEPIRPIRPIEPIQPIEPPIGPVTASQSAAAESAATIEQAHEEPRLSTDEAEAIEAMIIESDVDLEI